MFTGIVSAVAKVVEAGGGRLAIDHAAIAKHLKRGGSIAVNGCCLTVVKKKGPVFYADVVPETLRLRQYRNQQEREDNEQDMLLHFCLPFRGVPEGESGPAPRFDLRGRQASTK